MGVSRLFPTCANKQVVRLSNLSPLENCLLAEGEAVSGRSLLFHRDDKNQERNPIQEPPHPEGSSTPRPPTLGAQPCCSAGGTRAELTPWEEGHLRSIQLAQLCPMALSKGLESQWVPPV